MTGITLRFGDLEVRDFRGYEFTSAPLSLSGYRLDEISFRSLLNVKAINFRGVSFYGADLSKCSLRGLDFSHAIFNGTKLPDTVISCKLQGTTINGDLRKTHFENCDLLFANFTGARNLGIKQIENNKDWNQAHYYDRERVLLGEKSFGKSIKSYVKIISGDSHVSQHKAGAQNKKELPVESSEKQFSVSEFVNSHPKMLEFAQKGRKIRSERIAQERIGRSRTM